MSSCLLCCCCCKDKDNGGSGNGQRREVSENVTPEPVSVAGLLNPNVDVMMPREKASWTNAHQTTKGELERMRQIFWETAPHYGGRKPAWDVLKSACECRDKALSVTLCKSAGLLLPNGSLKEVYDESGFRYEIPDFCLFDSSIAVAVDKNEDDREKQKEKAIAIEGNIKLTLRFANNLEDKVLSVKKMASLGELLVEVDKLSIRYKEVLFFHQGQGPLAYDKLIGEIIKDRKQGLIQVLLR